jgi:L-asparaginase/Glu-tRNA(Gln) amidotransferase subunit D
VAVLSTGGTIASKQNPSKGGYEATFTGENLVAAVPAIQKVAQIQVEQISKSVAALQMVSIGVRRWLAPIRSKKQHTSSTGLRATCGQVDVDLIPPHKRTYRNVGI